jgi:hypothetical protein
VLLWDGSAEGVFRFAPNRAIVYEEVLHRLEEFFVRIIGIQLKIHIVSYSI